MDQFKMYKDGYKYVIFNHYINAVVISGNKKNMIRLCKELNATSLHRTEKQINLELLKGE